MFIFIFDFFIYYFIFVWLSSFPGFLAYESHKKKGLIRKKGRREGNCGRGERKRKGTAEEKQELEEKEKKWVTIFTWLQGIHFVHPCAYHLPTLGFQGFFIIEKGDR